MPFPSYFFSVYDHSAVMGLDVVFLSRAPFQTALKTGHPSGIFGSMNSLPPRVFSPAVLCDHSEKPARRTRIPLHPALPEFWAFRIHVARYDEGSAA
jgi:hypothetical protein